MRRVFLAAIGIAMLTSSFFFPTDGLIEGHVRYPGCFPPGDLTVCAEPEKGGDPICTDELSWTAVGYAYLLQVPAGRWFVYSIALADLPAHRAYYSKAVTCGLSISCRDHRPIVVEVEAGAIVEGVDPNDWFDDQRRERTPPPGAGDEPVS